MDQYTRAVNRIDASIEERAARLRSADTPSAAGLFPLPIVYADDIEATHCNIAEIVEDVLTQGGLSVMYGESNSGKSFMAIDLSAAVARGTDWLGKRTVQGGVLYVAGEGAESVKLRLVAYKQHHQLARGYLPIAVVPVAINMLDSNADAMRVARAAEEAAVRMGCPIRLIVIDTLARAMGSGNENSPEDMGAVVKHADLIREKTRAAVMFIHHSGKDQSKGSRGHSSLKAATDTEIEVTGDQETHLHTAEITKQRDLASRGDRITGKFVSVPLGIVNQWGKPLTTCVVQSTEQVHEKKPRVDREGPLQSAVLALLRERGHSMTRAEMSKTLTTEGGSASSVYNAILKLQRAGKVSEVNGRICLLDQ